MRDTIRLGRIAGIPIGVNWSIIAVAVYLVISLAYGAIPTLWPSADLQARFIASGSITFLFFVSILGHELGHAAAAHRHNVEVDGITLWVLGGIAKMRRSPPTPRAEFEIAFAGPAASLAIGFFFAGAALGLDRWSTWGLAASAASLLAVINVFLGLSNLIPIAPLDGGSVLAAFLWHTSGDAERARLITARSGLVAGVGVTAAAVGFMVFSDRLGWWMFAITAGTGAFIAHAAWRSVIAAVIRGRLNQATLGSVMAARPTSVPSDLSVDGFLRSTGSGPAIGRPVVHWGADPIGYVSPLAGQTMPIPDRSWTTIADVMIPVDQAIRAWSTETIADFMERSPEGTLDNATVIVVHDPRTGLPIGTVIPPQIDPLFAPPNPWGVSAPPPPPPAMVPAPL